MKTMNSKNDTPFWKALADPRRRLIVDLLREKPRTTGELCRLFGDVSRFAVMKHLNILQDTGLITVQREGRERWNLLNQEHLEQIWPHPTKPDDGLPGSYEIQETAILHAPTWYVFRAWTQQISQWWPERVAAGVVHLEPFVGGRFYEAFGGEGGGALLATVTYLEADRQLRFAGPMVAAAESLMGSTTLLFESVDGGTGLQVKQRLYGEVSGRLVDQYATRWHNRLQQALKPFVEGRSIS